METMEGLLGWGRVEDAGRRLAGEADPARDPQRLRNADPALEVHAGIGGDGGHAVELLQHWAEVHIGMYDSLASAKLVEQHPLRMAIGHAKILSLILIGYWAMRFFAFDDPTEATRLDPRAVWLFAVPAGHAYDFAPAHDRVGAQEAVLVGQRLLHLEYEFGSRPDLRSRRQQRGARAAKARCCRRISSSRTRAPSPCRGRR